MNFALMSAFAVIAALLTIFIKQYNPEYALLVSVAAGAVLLLGILSEILPAVYEIKDIASASVINSEYISVAIKALGICYITQFAADTCRDFGQTALSGKIELAGKVMIVFLSLPLIKNIIVIITDLIK